jgi:hypothetical protein
LSIPELSLSFIPLSRTKALQPAHRKYFETAFHFNPDTEGKKEEMLSKNDTWTNATPKTGVAFADDWPFPATVGLTWRREPRRWP